MTIQKFVAKWQGATLKERSAAQEHFIDLCRALGVPTPADIDRHGETYCFERGAEKLDGSQGWADAWLCDHFAWEYKGHHANLHAAYRDRR